MATNCCVMPFAMVGFAGVTPMETSAAGVTVKVTAGETTLPRVAVTEVVPGATAVANPCVPVAMLMVAVAVVEDVHVTSAVMVWTELSV